MHTALTLIGKRSHGAAVVVEGARPVGVVTPADCEGVDRFTQVAEVMTPEPTTVDLSVVESGGVAGLQAAFERLHASRRRFSPSSGTASWSGCSPRSARCARRSTPPPSTRAAGCGSRRPSASTAT